MSANILIVDDSLPMRSVIIKTIKASGFGAVNFYQAANGIEALQTLQDEWMDLVVTDYNMPDMDGLQLISEMRKDQGLGTIPVIVVTTEGSRKKVDEFMEKGASGYIRKPFKPEEIKLLLIKLLGEMSDEQSTEDGDDDLDF